MSILLSIILGAGNGTNNWWELVLPIWIIVGVAYAVDFTVRRIKKWWHNRKNKQPGQIIGSDNNNEHIAEV